MLPLLLVIAAGVSIGRADDPPRITVDHDNVVIDRSCVVVIPPGIKIDDADDDGVIHIRRGDITVRFEPGSVLRGSPDATQPDQYRGTAIRASGQPGVTIVGARIEGYKAGIWATSCDRITIAECSFDDLWRQHLKGTPLAEDQSDWLWPHKNDANEWLTNYGAAVYVEDCDGAVIRDLLVRRGQNGIILDRVSHAKVYDNDCSFLSGWGLAMWRSSDNMVSRNALDFCIRGYSHNVYNRGQDSAGILCFEQCCRNTFIENSATHGGDGFFGFAGREALGEAPAPKADFKYERLGCNDNILTGNDFSHAAAHGIEMTFSFGNRFHKNQLTGDEICGVWGGYSQQTIIDENEFTGNGKPGRGEGGGVNIEHGHGNIIAHNRFRDNSVGVSLWSGEAGRLAKLPWYAANHKGSDQNRVERSTFAREPVAVQLKQCGLTGVTMNEYVAVGQEVVADAESKWQPFHLIANEFPPVRVEPIGKSHPVGARSALAGGKNIFMGEWGPWDHESTLVRVRERAGAVHTFEWHKLQGATSVEVTAPDGSEAKGFTGQMDRNIPLGGPVTFRVVAKEPGVHPYKFAVKGPGVDFVSTGTLVSTRWRGKAFAFVNDPREKYEQWKAESEGPGAVAIASDTIDWALGYKGVSGIKAFGEEVAKSKIGGANYGIVASASVPLTPGKWRIKTLSDDGVRVEVTTGGGIGGKPETRTVIDNWTHHGPTSDSGEFTIEGEGATVAVIDVEYFQLDGFAVLKLEIEPVK
ncbi:MAG: NosD domain-containing protein [Phycisphaerales bacterium]